MRPLVLHLSLLAVVCELVVLLFCPAAHALPGGIASGSCNSCHIGGAEATLSVDFDPPVVQPGDQVTITIHVGRSGMKTAGFFIQSLDFPFFSDISGEPTHSTSDGVTHASPIRANGDEASVKVAWTAPDSPDGTVFNVAVVAANGDNSSRGDGTTWGSFGLVWGCDGIQLYWDGDNDGFGSEDLGTSPGCAAREDWAAEKGDCDGGDPAVNPGATEICNEDDDDCDGEIDEGTNPRTFYPDTDGDGFGVPGVDSMVYCGSLEGYADNSEDCDDDNAQIRPGATESCNKLDDNCDGRADEAACSAPIAPDPTPTASSSAPPAPTESTTTPSTTSTTSAPAAPTTSAEPTTAPSAVDEPDLSPVMTAPVAPDASGSPTTPNSPATNGNAGAPSQAPITAPINGDAMASSNESSATCSLNTARGPRAAWTWLPVLGFALLYTRRSRRANAAHE